MNGFERVSAALQGNPSDKVPIMLHNFLMAAREAGLTMEEFRSDPRNMAMAFIQAMEKYRYDGLLVDLDTVTLAGAAGVPVDFPVHEAARTAGVLLSELSGLRDLQPVRLEDYRYVGTWLESVRILKEHFGGEVFIRGNCDQAPFSLAAMLRGMDGFMTDLFMAEEELVFGLLEFCTGITSQFIHLMAQAGADMVSNGDSPAGPELISPEMYVKYALPFEKRIVEAAHDLDLPYGLHICGDTGLILDVLPETGADAFELDYKTDPALVLEKISKKATFIGNVDPSGVLALGSPDLVRTKTLELLKLYGHENRFILNAGCALPASTSSENMETFIRTAREFR
jgi:uroporphyrinogen decarboxylase